VQVKRLDQPPELQALALRDLFFVTAVLDELDEAERYANDRRALCLSLGDEDGASRALQNLGMVADLRGDLDRARTLYEAVVASGRERGVEVGIPLGNLAIIAWKEDRLTDAEVLAADALAELEAVSNQAQVADALTVLAGVRLYQGRRGDALPVLGRVQFS
jgi:MalT-like TPR region